MKKRNNRQHDYMTMGKKVLCGKFAERMRNNFAVGDQDNNLLLYNVETAKPITVLNTQTNNVSSITSLTFTQSDDQVIVGSNRGSLNVWDLNTLKISFSLKGHTVEICSLFADRNSQNMIISGSYDTNVKVWDLKTKNCVYTIKGHKMRVSTVSTSYDSKIVVTGGEDGLVQTWDLRMYKTLYQYQAGSSVLSLDCHPEGKIAAGCLDRVARLYEMNSPFRLIGSTKNDSMPITSVVFYKEDVLFTAGTDILKAWDISDDVYLTDNIQTSAKGILHMAVDQKIQQIAFSGGTLSYHQCFLSEVNFKSPYTFVNPSVAITSQKKHVNRTASLQKQRYQDPITFITNEKAKNLVNKRNQSLARQLMGVQGNINDALTNIKKASQQFNKKKNQTIELNELMTDEHIKFLKVMSNRAKSIQTMLDFWIKGNIKQVMYTMKNSDVYASADVLNQIFKPSTHISAQFAVIIAEKAKEMIKNKHSSIIKTGLTIMLQIVQMFKQEMIKLKVYGADQGVDLARQERLRKYDMLIEQYMQVYQSHRLKHLISKRDQTSTIAEKLSAQYVAIFKKVFNNEQF